MTEKLETCLTCQGTGNALTVFQIAIPCPTCQGTGKVKILVNEDLLDDVRIRE